MKVADRHQPAQKLHEAIARAETEMGKRSLDEALQSLHIQGSRPRAELDRLVVLGGRMVQVRADCMVLEDKLNIARKLSAHSIPRSFEFPGGTPNKLARDFFRMSRVFIADCNTGNLPKLAVEASICFARIAYLIASSDLPEDNHKEIARELLEDALDLCKKPFQNSEQLKNAVQDSIALMQEERYEEVTVEELIAIKKAMVSGPGGMMTHSGHWYNCVNGHPVSTNLSPTKPTFIRISTCKLSSVHCGFSEHA